MLPWGHGGSERGGGGIEGERAQGGRELGGEGGHGVGREHGGSWRDDAQRESVEGE